MTGPETELQKETMYVPGTDGNKMSKSRENTINIFLPDKKLRKQIMGIQTDSTPLEDPKDPESCNVFALYSLMADANQVQQLAAKYRAGGFVYGHAKQALFELIIEKFASARDRFNYYMDHLDEIDAALAVGAAKARVVANAVIDRVRQKTGYQIFLNN